MPAYKTPTLGITLATWGPFRSYDPPAFRFNQAVSSLDAAIGVLRDSAAPAPAVTEAGAELVASRASAGRYTRFTNPGAKTYSFDSAEAYTASAEYHGRNVGAGDLTLTGLGGFVINPPFGGSLVIPQGGTFTVKIVGPAEADLFGITTNATTTGELWTPANIATALWLDADDAATFALTGSDVDEWRDKSGNARHATPPTATKPTRTAAGINAMGSVVFGSGTDPLLTPSFDNPSGAAGLMLAMVLERSGEPVNFSVPYCKGPNNTQCQLIFPSSFTSPRLASIWRNNTSSGNAAVGPADFLALDVPYLFTGVMGSAVIAQFFQGAELSGSQGSASRSFGAASAATIGSTPNIDYTANPFHGRIGELVLVHADVTQVTRQKLEGYLAWKWGLDGNLPVGHPYKFTAPTT